MTFEQLVEEFERAHFVGLSENTVKGHRAYLAHLKSFFGMRKISAITVEMVEDYRDHRRQQPAKRNPQRTIKGATVNRELECLKCVFDLAVKRKYIPENPAAAVKHFNELRERPVRRMRHTSPETQRIYQLGMTVQVREAVEKSNERAYERNEYYVFMTFCPLRERRKKKAD